MAIRGRRGLAEHLGAAGAAAGRGRMEPSSAGTWEIFGPSPISSGSWRPGKRAGRPMTIVDYQKSAWDDFGARQPTLPFGEIPVYLGIGNHELIAEGRAEFSCGLTGS